MTKEELEQNFIAQKAAKKLTEWAEQSSRPSRNRMLVKGFIEKHKFEELIACIWYTKNKRSIPYFSDFHKVIEHTGKSYTEQTLNDLKVGKSYGNPAH